MVQANGAPHIDARDMAGRLGTAYWQIFRHHALYGIEWYSVKYGWIAACYRNVRHYSRFRSEQSARKVLATLS